MYYLSHDAITALNIKPSMCVKWVYAALKQKSISSLPPKYSLGLEHNVFINTMPSYIPEIERFGVKVVSRYPYREPALMSQILMSSTKTGTPLVLADGDWITAMRTGASAALSISLLESSHASVYSFIGLGNTARATLLCLLDSRPEKHFSLRLLKHKEQEISFIERFKNYDNVSFDLVENYEEAIRNADVIISSVTAADELFGRDEWFKEGVLVVPIHTRGFQNCDLFFDKVYCDDTSHIKEFKNFEHFKELHEVADILDRADHRRTSETERILVYNIGIALLDLFFLHSIFDRIDKKTLPKIELNLDKKKFWV